MAATLHLAQHEQADALLSADPLALLVGMVLDQQVPIERAFTAPYDLAQRLGVPRLSADQLAAYDPGRLAQIFAGPPALHRFPGSMAERTQALCRHLVEEYAGNPAAVWTGASDGAQLLRRIRALPGFGERKARIFVALLGKQLGVRPPGWREAAGEFGTDGSHISVADITGPQSLARVREHKRSLRAAAGKTSGTR